ncbi:[FeFe] hydrogenase H-cluster maturation GTPase HydF [Sediminispirochaeta smaragdinae]|uniref:Small GTP-binding protein n=1 Tax=Sediminispirochaeta smaragdinae (strain DSM 11293 / JCM 15392 / SEBR 4228) TaxID=573413 RepID=E1R2E6_SEDSS|nr:[FeFe] hydrogenase H-cluster maturation GTPase HydF [Sediminispirochaeta smaragdinae]ADK82506.1 small GTP-binding protein [Sediminispirochaeta smaragdinae DSM 11293]
MTKTPKGLRLHIGIFGKRNAGKSSILNALTKQQVSIVSDQAGTTTDPVEKPMELLPLGPVLFIDTAGIDDEGALGALRIEKSRRVMDRLDIALIVIEGEKWDHFEDLLLGEFRKRETPVIIVINKTDLYGREFSELFAKLEEKKLPYVLVSAKEESGILELKQRLLKSVPADFVNEQEIIGDIVRDGETAILVVPIDKEAPKGRLILPQVQTIRNILDSDACCMVVKERELAAALEMLKTPPKIVVTDSQAFLKVAADTPDDILMTSFSVLFARKQGDLLEMVRGTLAIDDLKSGDKILIAEACTHHPIAEDIGRVKIPRWLTQYTGAKLTFEHIQGHDFPPDLSSYSLVIHCGACMTNRREVLSRIMTCKAAAVPITNYGLTIAYSLGIFERALRPFDFAYDYWRNRNRGQKD